MSGQLEHKNYEMVITRILSTKQWHILPQNILKIDCIKFKIKVIEKTCRCIIIDQLSYYFLLKCKTCALKIHDHGYNQQKIKHAKWSPRRFCRRHRVSELDDSLNKQVTNSSVSFKHYQQKNSTTTCCPCERIQVTKRERNCWGPLWGHKYCS